MFNVYLQEVKDWLKVEADETTDDDLLRSLISAAKEYLYDAVGRREYGRQTEQAKLVCRYLIQGWYDDRDYHNRSPMTVRKPVITSLINQIKYGADESDKTFGAIEQASGTLRKRASR